MDATTVTPLLTVSGLRIDLAVAGRSITPVDQVSFTVAPGEALGIVGESGSGKSLMLRAILGLLPGNAKAYGSLDFQARASTSARGHGIAMVFQEPMTALNPTMRVGDLIAEGMRASGPISRAQAKSGAVDLLRQVGVPDPARRAKMWPHQLSGGLRQRAMIAAALATRPRLLLCDEPTTALDVTVQDQILGLLAELRRTLGMAMIFVSHDLAVVSEVCDRIAVMYAGQLVEQGPAEQVLTAPQHPYTTALLAAAPSVRQRFYIAGIPGRPPDPRDFPPGCRFAPRCGYAQTDCLTTSYAPKANGDGFTACIHPDSIGGAVR